MRRLTETRLRALIRDILLEGTRDDFEQLMLQLKDDEMSIATLQSLPPKWLAWLGDRYLRQRYPIESKDASLAVVLPLVKTFSEKDASISQKYKLRPDFREEVDKFFPPESRGWRNPADMTTMSAEDLKKLLELNSVRAPAVSLDRR